MEQTETIQPDNPQHGGNRFTRRLKSTGKMIVGLQQRLDNQMGYVSEVGQTHLKDNMYFKNGMYDNLDVVNFDQERFIQNLHMADAEDVVIQHNIKLKEDRANFESALKNAEKREIDEEFNNLCVKRLKRLHRSDTLKAAAKNHALALAKAQASSDTHPMFGASKPKIKIRELTGAKSGLPPRNPFYKNPELYPSGDAAFKPKTNQQWVQYKKMTLSPNPSSMPEIPLFKSPNRGGQINYDRNNRYTSEGKWQRTSPSAA